MQTTCVKVLVSKSALEGSYRRT